MKSRLLATSPLKSSPAGFLPDSFFESEVFLHIL